MRVKEAYNRSKIHERSEMLLGCKVDNLGLEKQRLYSMMPSRRSWIKLTFKERTVNGIAIDAVERNYKTIRKTINIDRRRHPKREYLNNLDNYCKSIVKKVEDGNIELQKPRIVPILKTETKDRVICRPLAIYNLEESILLKIIARYLTKMIDSMFSDASYAFRARKEVNGDIRVPTHHDIVGKILDYRAKNKNRKIYVYECDIQKFFDTISHERVKRAYKRLKVRLKKETGKEISPLVDKTLEEYLKSYSYYESIEKVSSSKEYWKECMHGKSKKNCQYATVSDVLIKNKIYKTRYRARYGIPQGGALSGIIANIVLDIVDENVGKIDSDDSIYIRYCDDTIVMTTDREICVRMREVFEKSLLKIRLIPHKACEVKTNNTRQFWNAKTKDIYIWNGKRNGVHWVGMVGYEVSTSGEVRIRRKSIRKEVRKQYEIARRTIMAIHNGRNRNSSRSLIETTQNKLIAMAVGRVRISNYKTYPSCFCWKNGFRKANDNWCTKKQMRYLDKKRNSYIRQMYGSINDNNITKKNKKSKRKVEYRTHYGKPYSYYYNIVKKQTQES